MATANYKTHSTVHCHKLLCYWILISLICRVSLKWSKNYSRWLWIKQTWWSNKHLNQCIRWKMVMLRWLKF